MKDVLCEPVELIDDDLDEVAGGATVGVAAGTFAAGAAANFGTAIAQDIFVASAAAFFNPVAVVAVG